VTSEIPSEANGPDRAISPNAAMADVPVWENWREYWELVRWLVPDVYRFARGRVFGLVILSSVGVAARAGTLGSMLLYIKARTKNHPIVFAGFSLPTEATLPVFLLWGSIAMGFAALTISASYRANVVTFDLGLSYAEMAVRRLLRHRAAGGEVILPQGAGDKSAEPIASMLRGDTNRLVRVVVLTLGVLLPLITLLVAVSVLIWTNWMLTLFLVPVAIGYAVALGLLNRALLRDSQKRVFATRNVGRDVQAMLRTMAGTRFPAGSEPEWLETYPRRTWLQESMGAFRRVILARRRVAYLADAFQGVGLLMVILVFGSLVADETTSWAVLLTYLVALGYATRSMGSLSGTVTAANRFLPQVRRYVLFMQMHGDSEPMERSAGRTGSFRFEACEPRLPGSQASLEASPGNVLWGVWNRRLDARTLGDFCQSLAGGDSVEAQRIESETFFLGKIARMPERPLRSYLPVIGSDDIGIEKRIHDFLEATGVREEFEAHFPDLDRVLTHDLDASLSPPLRYVLRLLPGVLSNPHLYILNLVPLAELGEESLERIVSSLADRVVIVVPRGRRDRPILGVAAVLVADDAAVRGIGDRDWHAGIEWPDLEADSEKDEAEWTDTQDGDDDAWEEIGDE